jgi:hypothetical protein
VDKRKLSGQQFTNYDKQAEVIIMRLPAIVIAAVLVCFPALPSIAQESTPSTATQPEEGAEVLGTVVRDNTTIIFQAAGSCGLDLNRLRTWSQFAEEHPKIATTLAYKPSLINDPGYLTMHPELATFFQAHPDIKDAMEENLGNFAAIPPRPGE